MSKINHDKEISKDFARAICKSLAAKGYAIVGATSVPDEKGSWLNSEVAYKLVKEGQSMMRTYSQVKALAA